VKEIVFKPGETSVACFGSSLRCSTTASHRPTTRLPN